MKPAERLARGHDERAGMTIGRIRVAMANDETLWRTLSKEPNGQADRKVAS